jgi:hypothetical protein
MKARFGNGRLIYPVKPNQAIYARFKHVTGLPSSSDEAGLSLSKLRSIDNLIDRLIHLKKTAGSSEQREAIDRIIRNLEMRASSSTGSVGQSVQEQAGDITSLLKQSSVYPPADSFQGLLFSISA